MMKISKSFAKGGIATAAVSAMALASATPAAAQDRDRDGISVGEVIAGAVILGGIAAVAGSIGRDRYSDDRYYGMAFPVPRGVDQRSGGRRSLRR